MPRQKKDSDGNVVPSEPKAPEVVIDSLLARAVQFALKNGISHHDVNSIVTAKFSTEVESVRREQVRQIAENLSPEEIVALLEQIQGKKAA